jgi:ribonucleoside-diphosphate reductase beta chain
VLKYTNKQVEYTSREENLHAMIGIKVINTIKEEYPELFDDELEQKIYHEANDAIKYECQIIEWIVNGYGHEQLNSDLLKEFIKNRMNESLIQIGYSPIFDVDRDTISKTTWFDEQVLGNNMTDFFHSRPVEYAKHSQSFDADDLF